MNKKIIVPLIISMLLLTCIVSSPQAFAESVTPTPAPAHNFLQGFVTFLSDKFNLDKSKVQSAVDEYREQGKEKHTFTLDEVKAREKVRLDRLVSEKKISADQEKEILDELATIWGKYNPDSFKNLSAQDRKTKMQQMRDELKSWAESHHIDLKYLMPGGMMKMKGMGRFREWK